MMNSFRCVELNGLATIELSGIVSGNQVVRLKKRLAELLDKGVYTWVFDLEKASYIDSAGLGAMVSHLSRCRKMGGDIAITAPNEFLKSVLHLSGINNMLLVFARKDQAYWHFEDRAK